MPSDGLTIVTGQEVLELLAGREHEVLGAVRLAYEAHAVGMSSLPHSTFLHFPQQPRNRIIALPAYLGSDFEIAGVKWISSFPGNLDLGLERASAVLILNSTESGRTEAIMEASVISAQRTAASAALAAQVLVPQEGQDCIGLIGNGVINFEILRYLRLIFPEVSELVLFDHDPRRAEQFKQRCLSLYQDLEIEVASDLKTVLSRATLISFATTASQPHITDLSACAPGTTILNISLRDLSPSVILSSDNIVDDADHVCRGQTSLHLTEQLTGSRDFIRCSLADILLGTAPARRDAESLAVFSPFGLGILDLAVGKLVRDLALQQHRGTVIDSFQAPAWTERLELQTV